MRVRGRRIIGFAVKNRMKTDSGIFKGQMKAGNVHGTQRVWIWQKGDGVRTDVRMGQECYLTDGFCLDEAPDLDHLVESVKEFDELRDYAKSTEGNIRTVIFHEMSILAVKD